MLAAATTTKYAFDMRPGDIYWWGPASRQLMRSCMGGSSMLGLAVLVDLQQSHAQAVAPNRLGSAVLVGYQTRWSKQQVINLLTY